MDEFGVIWDESVGASAVANDAVVKQDSQQQEQSLPVRLAPTQVLSKLIQQQNEITLNFIVQQLKSALPPRNVGVVDGNPLQYYAFLKAFEQGIEEKTTSSKDRIYFLEQFTSGEPNKLTRA